MAMTKSSAPKVNPLNPNLYALLEHKFGEVKFANAGSAANIQRFPDPLHPGRIITQAHWWGEYYCVCCPFCNDVGHKLWINHLYGADYDQRTGRRTDTFLAHCYKNDCVAQDGRAGQLEDMIFGPGKWGAKRMPIRSGDVASSSETIEAPGDIIDLRDLPPTHPAIQYLTSRQFDINELAETFHVGLCTDASSRYRIMNGRIYIPSLFNGQLVAWQGRLTRNTSNKQEIKYYTQGRKSRALYNYDNACRQPAVVLVEGAPSVWRLGRSGVSLFGKTLSYWQENTVATTWAGKPVFVMLDCDAQKELEQVVTQLCQHNVHVVPVVLPDARDPADYSREELRDILSSAAASVDVSADISFLE
jgi:hypothetical protein